MKINIQSIMRWQVNSFCISSFYFAFFAAMETIHYSQCPACASTYIEFVFTATDETVSKQLFEIWHCNTCSLRFTQHVPSAGYIGAYYKSADYISHTDTKKGMVNTLYHLVRNYTLSAKRRLVIHTTKKRGGNILDIGAGTGAFVNTMKKAGCNAEGIEPDEEARQVAAAHYNIELQESKAFYQLQKESYDAITMWHVLEHVHNLKDYVTQLLLLLKQGGYLFIAVPNYTSYDAVKYKNKWAAYDVPRHLYHFSPKSMRMLLEKHGFQLKGIQPMWFDSFYVSMLSEKYISGKSGVIAGAVTGLISNIKAAFKKDKCSSLIYIIQKKPA